MPSHTDDLLDALVASHRTTRPNDTCTTQFMDADISGCPV